MLHTPTDITIAKRGKHLTQRDMGHHVNLLGFQFGTMPPLAKKFASLSLSLPIHKLGLIPGKGQGAIVNIKLVNIHRYAHV